MEVHDREKFRLIVFITGLKGVREDLFVDTEALQGFATFTTAVMEVFKIVDIRRETV